MNPVDQVGVLFNFAGTNARVQARNGKDGPVYRISFEVDRQMGELFMGANLMGKIYGGQLMLIDPDQGDPIEGTIIADQPEPQPIKGGNVSRDAALLCKNDQFQRYISNLTGWDCSEDNAVSHLKTYCGITSRKELDHDPEAFSRFLELFHRYAAWRKERGLV